MSNYDEPIEMPRDILSKTHGPKKTTGIGYRDLSKVTPENCPHEDVVGGKCVDCGCWITAEKEPGT